MTLALDAMGGDEAPQAIVHGAVEAARIIEDHILLVGDPSAIEKFLPRTSIGSFFSQPIP